MTGAPADPGRPPGVEFSTFTVVGRCRRTGRLGVGTATRSLAVGARVPPTRKVTGIPLRSSRVDRSVSVGRGPRKRYGGE